MIYLYIKKHRKTGLLYLGKTVQQPYHYQGSGKRWTNHIKVHGYDVDTTILLATDNEDEIKETGMFFSKLFGIVESCDWANIREEDGSGGDTSKFIDYEKRNLGLKGKTYEDIHGTEKATMLKKSRGKHINEQRQGKTWKEIFGPDKAASMKAEKSKSMKGRPRGPMSQAQKDHLRSIRTGTKVRTCCCFNCHREIALNNFKRHYLSCIS